MDVLVTCKDEEDPIKNDVARVFTTFSPITLYMGDIPCHGNQRSGPKPNSVFPPDPMMLQIS